MLTKSKPSQPKRLSYNKYYEPYVWDDHVDTWVNSGGDTITYEDGPKYINYRCNWKRCEQRSNITYTGQLCSYDITASRFTRDIHWTGYFSPSTEIRIPSLSINEQELWDKYYSNLDLNVDEAVMAYSAVIQAVPLLGGLAKANRILNSIGRWARKSLRHRPFTEVVKQAIQADFVNRFVIQTTLQDLHMVQDSMDYVLRTIRTAHERNHALTAVKTEYTNVVSSESSSGTWYIRDPANPSDGRIVVNGEVLTSHIERCALFVLADVKYDTDAISPLKLWAARVGLTRPLESIWDLVPFSFVLDYFARTGDYLTHLSQELTSQEGLKGKIMSMYGSWVTGKAEKTVRSIGKSYAYSLNPWMENRRVRISLAESTAKAKYFIRRPSDGVTAQSSFWDQGGMISPHLSLVRARTLAELWLQAKLR
jgi:hypothetical protein